MSTLYDLVPFVSADLKKEIEAVAKIQKLFPGKSMAEIGKQFEKYLKTRRTSVEGLADRIGYFRAQSWPDGVFPETADAIVLDYQKMKASDSKALGKAIKITLLNCKDPAEAAALACWLNGGPEPPTEVQKVAELVKPQADQILALMDQRLEKTISIDDCVSQCKTIVDAVAKQFKAPGLLSLGEQIRVPGSPKDSAVKLAKALKTFFDDRRQKWKRDLDIDHA